ncbi:MAG: hypothetical protein M3O02_12475 [Acidobacteriota bacterium]|nr:hypothetical protein [Acidobacteriota bacterium]
MIARRTAWLAVLALVSSAALGVVLDRRERVCAQTPRGYARRAPIAGASGRDTFVCRAMVEHMPVADVAVAAVWWVSVLALLRSAWMDRSLRRERRRSWE